MKKAHFFAPFSKTRKFFYMGSGVLLGAAFILSNTNLGVYALGVATNTVLPSLTNATQVIKSFLVSVDGTVDPLTRIMTVDPTGLTLEKGDLEAKNAVRLGNNASVLNEVGKAAIKNKVGELAQENEIGKSAGSNKLGENAITNEIGKGASANYFGESTNDNYFGNSNSNNHIGSFGSVNTIEGTTKVSGPLSVSGTAVFDTLSVLGQLTTSQLCENNYPYGCMPITNLLNVGFNKISYDSGTSKITFYSGYLERISVILTGVLHGDDLQNDKYCKWNDRTKKIECTTSPSLSGLDTNYYTTGGTYDSSTNQLSLYVSGASTVDIPMTGLAPYSSSLVSGYMMYSRDGVRNTGAVEYSGVDLRVKNSLHVLQNLEVLGNLTVRGSVNLGSGTNIFNPNNFGNYAEMNFFGSSATSNVFGYLAETNSIGQSATTNNFGPYAETNNFGYRATKNVFGATGVGGTSLSENFFSGTTTADNLTINDYLNVAGKGQFGSVGVTGDANLDSGLLFTNSASSSRLVQIKVQDIGFSHFGTGNDLSIKGGDTIDTSSLSVGYLYIFTGGNINISAGSAGTSFDNSKIYIGGNIYLDGGYSANSFNATPPYYPASNGSIYIGTNHTNQIIFGGPNTSAKFLSGLGVMGDLVVTGSVNLGSGTDNSNKNNFGNYASGNNFGLNATTNNFGGSATTNNFGISHPSSPNINNIGGLRSTNNIGVFGATNNIIGSTNNLGGIFSTNSIGGLNSVNNISGTTYADNLTVDNKVMIDDNKIYNKTMAGSLEIYGGDTTDKISPRNNGGNITIKGGSVLYNGDNEQPNSGSGGDLYLEGGNGTCNGEGLCNASAGGSIFIKGGQGEPGYNGDINIGQERTRSINIGSDNIPINITGLINLGGTVKVNGTKLCLLSVGGCSEFSDRRLKDHIIPLTGALQKVIQLAGVTFRWKDPAKTGENIGSIAQEVQKLYPEVIHEDSDGYLHLAYQNLVAPVVEAIKELYTWITAIDTKLTQTQEELIATRKELEALRVEVEAMKKTTP